MPAAPSAGDPLRHPVSDSLKLLCVCATEPRWTSLSLQLDRLGCTQPRFRWCSSQALAAEVLREGSFDLLLIGDPGPGDTDPLAFAEGLRQGGLDEPMLLVSTRVDDAWFVRCGEQQVAVMSAASGWESRALGTWIVRTVRQAQEGRELQRLQFDEVRRRAEVREDVALFTDQLSRIGGVERRAPGMCPEQLTTSYAELLQTYVFFGHGRLDLELDTLARAIAHAGLWSSDVVHLHADCSQRALARCGARSTRSLQGKIDLLLIEVLVRLADEYRRRGQLHAAAEYGIDLDTLAAGD